MQTHSSMEDEPSLNVVMSRDGQLEHLLDQTCPVRLFQVPLGHGYAALVEQKWPEGHTVQLSACQSSVPLKYFPSSHDCGATAPSLQYEPAGQLSHAVVLLTPWYLPLGQ